MNKIDKSITITGQLYSTMDYDKFSFLDKNRVINQKNLKQIIESMKEEQLIIPIVVNEKYEIIDGQHRFHAAKQLGKPVYYIVIEGYGIEQVKRANTTGSKWVLEDFLRSHKHNINYIMVTEVKKIYGLQLNTLLRVISSITNSSFDVVKDTFKTGSFIFTEPQKIEVMKFCEQLKFFEAYKGHKANAFILAFLKLYLYEDYDAQHMEKQAKRHMEYFNPPAKNQESLLEELCQNVYSYRLPKDDNKIFYAKNTQKFYR